MVTVTGETTRREQILEAALVAFLDHGLAGASIEEICVGSGASVGSVYHHFGGKEGLAGALYLDSLADYQLTFLMALRAHDDDAEAGVRAVVRAHLRWCLGDRPERARFLLFHGAAVRGASVEALKAANREFFGVVLAWWRPHARDGTLRELELDVAYALWLGPAQEFCRLHVAGRNNVSPDRAAPLLAGGAWQALNPRGDP